jgi:hypothetical protein
MIINGCVYYSQICYNNWWASDVNNIANALPPGFGKAIAWQKLTFSYRKIFNL